VISFLQFYMAKAKPRSIRLDEEIDLALDLYVEDLRKTDEKVSHNSVINEFCGDRLIAKKLRIEDRMTELEQRVAKLESKSG